MKPNLFYLCLLLVGNSFTNAESLQFDFAAIKDATRNFTVDNKLGEGGFGEVYKVQYLHNLMIKISNKMELKLKISAHMTFMLLQLIQGKLLNGQEVAVKRLSRSSGQGTNEFMNEVMLVAKLQHRNLVRLLGFCLQGEEKMLVYEYVPNRSLDYFLFGMLDHLS